MLNVFLFKDDFEFHKKETDHKCAARMKVDTALKLAGKNILILKFPS